MRCPLGTFLRPPAAAAAEHGAPSPRPRGAKLPAPTTRCLLTRRARAQVVGGQRVDQAGEVGAHAPQVLNPRKHFGQALHRHLRGRRRQQACCWVKRVVTLPRTHPCSHTPTHPPAHPPPASPHARACVFSALQAGSSTYVRVLARRRAAPGCSTTVGHSELPLFLSGSVSSPRVKFPGQAEMMLSRVSVAPGGTSINSSAPPQSILRGRVPMPLSSSAAGRARGAAAAAKHVSGTRGCGGSASAALAGLARQRGTSSNAGVRQV